MEFSTAEDMRLEMLKIHDYRGVQWDEALHRKNQNNGVFHVDEDQKVPYLLYKKGDKVCF